MRYWKAVVVLVMAFSWVAEVWMRIDPDDFQVLVMRVEGVECWCSDGVVSSDSQHDAVWMFLESCKDAIVDLSEQIIKQLQVPHVVVGLQLVGLGRFVVG